MKNIIKEQLFLLLENKNWSLQKLAQKASLSLDTVKSIYYGRNDNPKLETMVAMADALDVSVDFLIGRKIFAKDEYNLLKNYRLSSNHGKQFVQEMAKYEAFYTDYENQQTHERSIVCVEPTGYFQNGILWDSCKVSRVTTYLPQVYFAFRIPTYAFLPTYAQGEVLLVEHRLPKEGENAIFYKDNKVYVRNFLYSKDTGFFTLKAISMDAQDLVVKNLKEYQIIGTIIIPDRATDIKDTETEDVVLPLDVQELIDKIKEPQ